jgi:hypothetical protein
MTELNTAVTFDAPKVQEAPKAALPVVFDFQPKSLDEALRLAEVMSKSTIVPKDYVDKPGNVLVAIQWGMELGLKPLAAMQNIAVINGRPSLWGDAVIALVRASPLCEGIREEFDTAQMIATCIVKRRGEPETSRSFSLQDATKANLIGKDIWKAYPKRMLQMRARAFALRDVFPDVLRGMPIAEEVMDYQPQERDITPPAAAAPAAAAATPPRDATLDLALAKRADAICAAFDKATTDEELHETVNAARRLPDGPGRAKALEHYKTAKLRVEATKSTVAEPVKEPEQPPEPALSPTDVASMIGKAASKDEADLAADSIRAFSEEEQVELWKLYNAKVAALK